MKTQYWMIIVLAVFTSRCTHIRNFSTLNDVNKVAQGKKASITLTSGQVFAAKDIQASRDSTFWLDFETNQKQSIAAAEISHVVIKKSGRGAWEGFGIGFLVGSVTGALIGFASGDDEFLEVTAEEKALGYGLLFGGGGGLLGSFVGAKVGSKDKFILHENKEK